jgi:hypothetical protein
MTSWVACQRSWLRVELLPGYAPELNPVEGVWGNVKAKELANLCTNTVEEMEQTADDGLCRIGSDRKLCFASLLQAPLRFSARAVPRTPLEGFGRQGVVRARGGGTDRRLTTCTQQAGQFADALRGLDAGSRPDQAERRALRAPAARELRLARTP